MSIEPQEKTPSHHLSRLVFGVDRGIASTVYGTVTVMATIAAAGPKVKPWTLLALVASTVLVLWVAHLYSHALSESIAEGEPLRPRMVLAIAGREIGILGAAAMPVAALLLGSVGIMAERTSIWVAIGLGLLTLVVEGIRYARLERLSRGAEIMAVATNVTLGLFVVLLKVALHH